MMQGQVLEKAGRIPTFIYFNGKSYWGDAGRLVVAVVKLKGSTETPTCCLATLWPPNQKDATITVMIPKLNSVRMEGLLSYLRESPSLSMVQHYLHRADSAVLAITKMRI
jgi:hypothetical protein